MYVKIVDRRECYSTTMEFVDGVYANKTEWAKHNFYPQNGMVGEVRKVTPRAYIVKVMEGIYIPMTKKGIREITYQEYMAEKGNNACSGMDERQQKINDGTDSIVGDSWMHLPDMREYFKKDIIQNMKKLTCDFERNIFLPDLERSCVIYATDVVLEYKIQWGATLPPYVIDEISNQVIDVYRQFFSSQFLGESVTRSKRQIKELVGNPNAREQIDDYYHKVNMRYAMHLFLIQIPLLKFRYRSTSLEFWSFYSSDISLSGSLFCGFTAERSIV